MKKRKGKLGLGTAYIHGFKWALERNYEFVFEMDADFSHNPNDLLKLYDSKAEVNHFIELIPSANDIFIQTINNQK